MFTRLRIAMCLIALSTLNLACNKSASVASPSTTITSSIPLTGFLPAGRPLAAGHVDVHDYTTASNAGPGTETVNVLFDPDDPAATAMLFATNADATACQQRSDCSKALVSGRTLSIHVSTPGFIIAIVNFSARDLSYGFNYSFKSDS